MASSLTRDENKLTWEQLKHLDEIADRFEASIKANECPRIEDYLEAADSAIQPELLYELVAVEIEHRRRRGDLIDLEDYARRFRNCDFADPARLDALRFASAVTAIDSDIETNAEPRLQTLPEDSLESPPQLCTRFRIVRSHASGGLGEVFVARDDRIGRSVAIKKMQDWVADNAEARARFLLEAEVTGSLEHPGVVPLYGLGSYADGRPFYAMRFVQGESLKDALARFHSHEGQSQAPSKRNLAFRDLLRRFIDVCNTIAYAHSKGVVHRDLKPANILLGRYGETLVVDWGLAKLIGGPDAVCPSEDSEPLTLQPNSLDGATPTRAGKIIGTPGYMSPEQAEGRLESIGPASDIYGLGATLFHLLTGHPPVNGPHVSSALRGERDASIPRPKEGQPAIPRVLAAICLKALSPCSADRYASAEALAEDVEHFLADEAVTAFPERPWHIAGRWMKRHNAAVRVGVAALTLIATTSITAATIVADYASREAASASEARAAEIDARKKQQEAERLAQANATIARENEEFADREIEAREAAEEALLQSEWMVYSGQATLALRAWQEGDLQAAWDSFRSFRWDFRDWEYHYLLRLLTSNRVILHGNGGSFEAAVRRDGKFVATTGKENEVLIWDAFAGSRKRRLVGHTAPIRSLSFVANGDRHLVTGSDDGTVRLWNYETGSELRVLGTHAGGVTSLDVTRDGENIATTGRDRTVRIWNTRGDDEPTTFSGISDDIVSLDFAFDGKWLLGGGADGKVRVFDLQGEAGVKEYPVHPQPIQVAFHPSGEQFALGSMGGDVQLWDVKSLTRLTSFDHPPSAVMALDFRHDGAELATGAADGIVRIWDVGSGRLARSLKGHKGPICSASYAMHGQRLITSSKDGTVSFWNPDRGQGSVRLEGHRAEFTAVSANNRGNLVATAGRDGTVRLWDARRERETRVLECTQPDVLSVAVSPDGLQVAAGAGPVLHLWDTATGGKLDVPRPAGSGEGNIVSLAFTPDSGMLACGDTFGNIQLIGFTEATTPRILQANPSAVTALAFDSGGSLLASGGNDKLIRLWNVQTGELLGILEGQGEEIACLSFSPDDTQLVSGSGHQPTPRSPGSVRIWDVARRAPIHTLLGHDGAVTGVAFSPSGRRVISTSADRTLRVWNAETGGEVFQIRDEYPLWGLAMCSRGNVAACIAKPQAESTVPGFLRLFYAAPAQNSRADTPLSGHTSAVFGLAVRPDGKHVASATIFGDLKIWESDTGKELLFRKSGLAGVYRLEYDAQARLVGVGPSGLMVWDNPREPPRLSVPLSTHITGLAVTPDGSRAILSAREGRLKAIDLGSGDELWQSTIVASTALCVRLDVSGRFAITGHEDGMIRLWDAMTGKEIRAVNAGAGPIHDLAVRPGRSSVAAACAGATGNDGRVRVFELPTLEQRLSIAGHVGEVYSVLYSPDGNEIASGGADCVVRIWDASTGIPIGRGDAPNSAIHRLAADPRGRRFFGATDGGPDSLTLPGEIWCWRWRGSDR